MALLHCSNIQADRVYSRAVNKNLRDLILAHPDTKKKVNVFALSVYGLVVFPALGHVDEAVTDLFDRLDKGVTPVSEIVAIPRRDDILEEKWMEILRNLREEDIEWIAPWMLPDEILYRCGNFDWVPLLGIWGAVGYAPLLVLRRFRSRQFVPETQGLAQCEFSYKDDGYKKKIREMSNAWNQTRRMKRLAVGPIATPEYIEWWGRRINDNISGPSQGDELEKKIEQMEEEKMNLRLDMDVQKLEIEKLRKRKDKAEGDLDSLKTDYKRLRCSMKAAGLGKTSKQWCQEIQEGKIKVDRWER
ncbi:hypothetical protein Gotur_027266, partial [Gossypium turneri]